MGSVLERKPIKVAYGSVPKDGGTFTFYRNLRPVLCSLGVDLTCVTLGGEAGRLVEYAFVDEGCIELATNTDSLKKQAKVFVDWCQEEAVDIVIGINSAGILSALPHLPETVRVVARCANGFDQGYRVTMSGRERLARIVAIAPRLRDDLIERYGADAEQIELIPNGVSPVPYNSAAIRTRGTGQVLEVGFLGRLEHTQKGVLHLPGIADALSARHVPFRLKIAGKGRHEPELRRGMAAHLEAGRAEFLGPLEPAEIPKFLEGLDALAFTSHFEGCPNALLEAMMAGVVPVCWRLDGITDCIVEHGRTGYLCETGNVDGFASLLQKLAEDRELAATMSVAVAKEARLRYSDGVSADAYAALFSNVMSAPPIPWTPRPWSEFRPDPSFPRGLRHWIPARQRELVKRLLSRSI